MEQSIRDKVAIVTGGAMGIGFGIVKRFAAAGVKTLLADINGDVAGSSR